MKIVRGLYMVVCYALEMPLLVLIGIPAFVWLSIDNKIHCGEFNFKGLLMAALEGLVTGHRINMLFVKYGRNYDYVKESLQ